VILSSLYYSASHAMPKKKLTLKKLTLKNPAIITRLHRISAAAAHLSQCFQFAYHDCSQSCRRCMWIFVLAFWKDDIDNSKGKLQPAIRKHKTSQITALRKEKTRQSGTQKANDCEGKECEHELGQKANKARDWGKLKELHRHRQSQPLIRTQHLKQSRCWKSAQPVGRITSNRLTSQI
jgi:hypothetical protein